MDNRGGVGEFLFERTKKEVEREKKSVGAFLKQYPIPKSNYYLKKWVGMLGYSIREDRMKSLKVLYKGDKRITKWNEYIDHHFRKHIWNLILDRVAREEVSILGGDPNGLPEDELTQEKILEYLAKK